MSTNRKQKQLSISGISVDQPLQLAEALVSGQNITVSVGEGDQTTSTTISISRLEKEDGSGRKWIFSGLLTSPLLPSCISYEAFVSFDHMERSWFNITE